MLSSSLYDSARWVMLHLRVYKAQLCLCICASQPCLRFFEQRKKQCRRGIEIELQPLYIAAHFCLLRYIISTITRAGQFYFFTYFVYDLSYMLRFECDPNFVLCFSPSWYRGLGSSI